MTKYHYVYRITNTQINKHYYGVRSSKVEPKLDLGFKYFSSSRDKEFIKEQKENKDVFKYKIIKLFESREEADLHERRLHKKFNVRKHESFYNKHNANERWSTYGNKHTEETKAKMKESKTGSKNNRFGIVWTKESKSKSSETQKGICKSEETKAKMKESANNRQPISEKTRKNMSIAQKGRKHTEETKSKMKESKKNISEESKAKMRKPQKKSVCIHCGKEGGINNLKRYHFDNCKSK